MKDELNPTEPSEVRAENNPHKTWLIAQLALLATSNSPKHLMIYRLLKKHLQPLGYWKERPRGKAFEPGNKVGPINSSKKE